MSRNAKQNIIYYMTINHHFAAAALLIPLGLLLLNACDTAKNATYVDVSAPEPTPIVMNQEITSHEGEPILVGPINRAGLSSRHYKDWFDPAYQAYTVDSVTLLPFKQQLRGLDVLVFMGTWCSDSQAQVPQFYRILDWVGYDEKKLRVVSLDNHPDRYKKSPDGAEQPWSIESVPTFILLKNGREIGRIVEYPSATLEKDMARMIAGLGRE